MNGEGDPIEDYDPLTAKQFKPEQSGNRRGRPKGSKGMKTIVKAVAHERHAVTEDGVKQRLTTIEIIFKVLHHKSLGGDLQAKRLMDDLRDRFSPEEANNKGHGCLLVPGPYGGTLNEQMAMLGVPIEEIEEFP